MPLAKELGDLLGGDHRGDGVTVPHRLAQGHDVGHDSLQLEGPEGVADPSKAGLHFVGHAHASGLADVLVGSGQVAGGRLDLPSAAQDRLGDERRDAVASQPPGRRLHFRGVALAELPVGLCVGSPGWTRGLAWARGRVRFPSEPPPIRVGHRRHGHALASTVAAWSVELVRADLDQPAGVPVVPALEDDHAVGAGVAAGQAQGQLVGLAAGADQEDHVQRRREVGRQLFRQRDDLAVEVPRVGRQHAGLASDGGGDAPVGVPPRAGRC